MTREELIEKIENDLRFWLEPPDVLWRRRDKWCAAIDCNCIKGDELLAAIRKVLNNE
jgi:hypothetical protein